MKKIILLTGGIILSIAGFAQFHYGVQATGSLASAKIKSKYDLDFTKDMSVLPGGGIVLQCDLGNHLSVRGAVNYLQQGVTIKHTEEDGTGSTTSKAQLDYVQVPVHAIYNMHLGPVKLYAGLGGYAGYGFSGTIKNTLWFNTPDGGYDFVEKLKAFKKLEDDGGNLQKADYGVSGIAGVQLGNGIFIQAGYQRGLANISRDKEDTYKNTGGQLTIGYFFR